MSHYSTDGEKGSERLLRLAHGHNVDSRLGFQFQAAVYSFPDSIVFLPKKAFALSLWDYSSSSDSSSQFCVSEDSMCLLLIFLALFLWLACTTSQAGTELLESLEFSKALGGCEGSWPQFLVL